MTQRSPLSSARVLDPPASDPDAVYAAMVDEFILAIPVAGQIVGASRGGVGGLVGKALAGGLDIRFGTEVERVERSGTGWRLLFDDTPGGAPGNERLAADAPLEATPAEQESASVSPPLTAERMAAGEFKIDVAILAGPDNLWIELNEIHEPADTNWFPGA